jgi:hypothetical protein
MDLSTHGHGHVVPRLDGALARCGGPAICAKCALEKAEWEAEKKQFTDSIFKQSTCEDIIVNTPLDIANRIIHLDSLDKLTGGEIDINDVVTMAEHLKKLEYAVTLAKELRFYCLGSDASTQNMIKRFDFAIELLGAQ